MPNLTARTLSDFMELARMDQIVAIRAIAAQTVVTAIFPTKAFVITVAKRNNMKHYLVILLLLGACGQVPDESPAPVIPDEETAPSDETSSDEPVVADAEPIAEDGEPIVAAAEDEEFSGNWLDPVTGRKWLTGGIVDAVDAVCDVGYEVPDIFDIFQARDNGLAELSVEHSISTETWTKNLSDGVIESWRDITDVSRWADVLTGARLWCVEEN